MRKAVSVKRTAKYRHAVELVKTLKAAHEEAFLVGGCVRDLLMGRLPKDYDIATSAHPEKVAKLFPKTIPMGVQFGVLLVLKGDYPYEVATFRTDRGYRDGRHPVGVVFSSAKEDALRRDFTINGLFLDPLKNRVIDYVGGERDLESKVIRAIGDPAQRFEEDKLRVLRAVRFAANLAFPIDPTTFQAIQKAAHQILQVSAERIRDELVKLFTGPHPGKGLALLEESGLLKVVLPEVDRMKGVLQPPEFHPEGDVFTHTQLVLDRLKNSSTVLGFGALLHDVGKPPTFKVADRIRFDGHDRVGADMARAILRRLRFSNVETDGIVTLVRNHMKFKDVRQMRLSTLKRFVRAPTFPEELKLHRADCLASHGDLSNWRFLKRKLKALPPEKLKPKRLLDGHDLLKLGFPQGPTVGVILRSVEEKQLDGELSLKADALAWVKKSFSLGASDHLP